MSEIRAAGLEGLALTTRLLQRARLADPRAGMWEAADHQWWWRRPRASDAVEQVFWTDDEGPVAGVVLTAWPDGWQCDPIVVPHASAPPADEVWARAVRHVGEHAEGRVELPLTDRDTELRALVEASGMVPGLVDNAAWLDSEQRPTVLAPREGYVVVDRSQRRGAPHPMAHRNGEGVEARLASTSLYDPGLDLCVETADGEVAGYILCWFDPVTSCGLVEPVRVVDDHQRRGLARAMLTEGIDRLARRGAHQVKIGFQSEAAGALYQGVGFRVASTDTWYEGQAHELRL